MSLHIEHWHWLQEGAKREAILNEIKKQKTLGGLETKFIHGWLEHVKSEDFDRLRHWIDVDELGLVRATEFEASKKAEVHLRGRNSERAYVLKLEEDGHTAVIQAGENVYIAMLYQREGPFNPHGDEFPDFGFTFIADIAQAKFL